MTFPYRNLSPEQEKRRDRIQFILSGFVLFISISEVLEKPTPLMVALGLASGIMGLVHVYCALRYEHLKARLNSRMDLLLFRIAGVVLLLNGVTLKAQGSHTVWALNLFMGLVHFFVLPWVHSRAASLFTLTVDETGLIHKRLRRPRSHIAWADVAAVEFQGQLLTVHVRGRKRPRSFWFDQGADEVESEINKFMK